MTGIRRRHGDDPWVIDGALPTDDVRVTARLRPTATTLLYFTKRTGAHRLAEIDPEVREADYWQRYAVPTRTVIDGLGPIFRPYVSIRFVGDLDPCDLATFRALQCGSPTLVPRRGWSLPIVFAGVTSAWMEVAERWPGPSLERVSFKMSRLERAQFRALRDSWPELPKVIGDRAMELLDSGRKVEVEGATIGLLAARGSRAALLDLILGGTRPRRKLMRRICTGSAIDACAASKALRPDEAEQAILTRVATHVWPPLNQFAAVYALSQGMPATPPDVFVGILSNPDVAADVRGMAAEALGSALWVHRTGSGYRKGIAALVKHLTDASPDVRWNAAFGLGVTRDRRALPALRRLARSDRAVDPSWGSVSDAARDAIASIENARPRPTPSRRLPK